MNKSRVEVSKVLAHKKMWQELKTHHNSLAWSQKTMEDALLIVAGEQGKHVWPRELDEGEMASFSLRMARRIRTQARHITQAIAKNPQTGWLLRLWEEGHGGDEPGVEEQAMVQSDWFYGYDRQLRKSVAAPPQMALETNSGARFNVRASSLMNTRSQSLMANESGSQPSLSKR